MRLGNRRTRIVHMPSTGLVHVQLYKRQGSKKNRRFVLDGNLTLRRDHLRTLCDLLHDYADHLDAQDRHAAAAGGKGVPMLESIHQCHLSRSEISPSDPYPPSRARTREEAGRG